MAQVNGERAYYNLQYQIGSNPTSYRLLLVAYFSLG